MKVQTRRMSVLPAIAFLILPLQALPDICGCAGSPDSLGDFDAANELTYPPGTTRAAHTITIPLPDDGILIFDSMIVDLSPSLGPAIVNFERTGTTRRNTPVTLLVAGDVTITGTISVDGADGNAGNSGNDRSIGGPGGPGGFRGADGAFQAVDPTQSDIGGYGFGPGGGAPGDPAAGSGGVGGGGNFVGSADLLPLVGGAGGGGGNSRDITAGCGGGGGGGGGGALLLAANGTVDIDNGNINAIGGGGGNGAASCASSGGGGAGGAVRILADTIDGSSSGTQITATGAGSGADGVIRIEAFTDTFPVTASNPLAFRSGAPGPLTSPLQQSVGITSVGGETVSVRNNLLLNDSPQGAFGEVDVVLQAPGSITINVATTGVPAGTSVEVSAKDRRGGNLISSFAPLAIGNCDASGNCQAATSLDLAAGQYVLEARATFQP